MKTNLYFTKTLLCTFALAFLAFTKVHAQLSYYAPLPYFTGFENNALDSNWYTTSSLPTGRIQVWNNTSFSAAATPQGNYWLGLDHAPPAGMYNLNEAWIGLNTLGASNLHLRFWWSEWNDETEAQDGIYLSDNGGSTFTKVIDLNGASYTDLTWRSFDFNLDSINSARGLSYTANYVIKIEQYDNYYFSGGNDGFLFDDISISNLPTAVKENKFEKLSIYPNPANSFLTVNFGEMRDFVDVKIKNLMGEVLVATNFTNSSNGSIALDLPAGIYFVELSSNESVQLLKFSKQ